MKWFKHEVTNNNPKLMLIRQLHGAEAYGVYFQILELIAGHIEPDNENEWGYLPITYSKYPHVLAKAVYVEEARLNEILTICYEVGLLENREGRIYCGQILERCDRYTELLMKQKKHKNKKTVHKSVVTVHKSVESTPRIEKNRKEENKNITNTDVLEGKALAVYGNTDINEGMEKMQADIGQTVKALHNRYALNRLFKRYGKERVFRGWDFAQKQKEQQYCPSIHSFIELEQKWTKLEEFAKRSVTGPGNNRSAVFKGGSP